MPRIVNILLLAVVLPLALILGLLLAVPYFVTLDSFGPRVAARLEPALGRKVHMGHIHLSVLPLELIVDQVGISEDPAFGTGDFAKMDRLLLDISLVALLNRQVDVTTLEADKPSVKLIKNGAGAWNIDSLGGGVATGQNAPAPSSRGSAPDSPAPSSRGSAPDSPAKAAGGAVAGAQTLEIEKLRLKNGSFTLDDLSGPVPAHQEFTQVDRK